VFISALLPTAAELRGIRAEVDDEIFVMNIACVIIERANFRTIK
jgi:hypothetical protein